MHSLERRHHHKPVKKDNRKPILSIVKQAPQKSGIMSEKSQYYLYYVFVGSMPFGGLFWFYIDEIKALFGVGL